MSEPEEIKVVLIGDSGVGKSSIISQYINHKFDPSCEASTNSEFSTKIVDYPEHNISLKFNIWDTMGQEKYRSLTKIFYKNADVVILVYDVTCEESFDSIKNYWYNEVIKNADLSPIIALVGNKADLCPKDKLYNKECVNYANEINAMFEQISAMSSSGVNGIFEKIGKLFVDPKGNKSHNLSLLNGLYDFNPIKNGKNNNKNNNNIRYTKNNSIKLHQNINKSKEKKKCC